MSIESNLAQIKQNISAACSRAGRDPSEVTILAVTKTIDADRINHAVSLGLTDLGENRVQELLSKYELIHGDVRWHLIGHLQTNKVKYIADKVCMIHSVESISLAKEIEKQCAKIDKVMDILIEVNVSGEESKSGITPAEALAFAEEVSKFEHIRVKGLMTMAPFDAKNDELHQIFSNLYKISVDISSKKLDNVSMGCLSMGMTGDYEVAVEEKSTIVRIGTGLFK
ncbi:MAG: YggS family pyridoxal phosphate-dependent enzyme [Clostridia bacterium]|nr:YggS family pyridoxal phosphate-dependent enzyme [Clostridia bacterium]